MPRAVVTRECGNEQPGADCIRTFAARAQQGVHFRMHRSAELQEITNSTLLNLGQQFVVIFFVLQARIVVAKNLP